MNHLQVPIIISSGCDDCEKMKGLLVEVALEAGIALSFDELDFEKSDDAIDLALNYDISDLPAAVIGEVVFQGNNINRERVKEVLLDETGRKTAPPDHGDE